MVQILTCQNKKLVESDDFSSFKAEPKKGLVWLDFFNASETELDGLAEILNLHPVTRAELSRPSNRPKLADYDRYLSLTIHVPRGHLDEPHSHEIDIVVGANWIVTVHEQKIKGLLSGQELCRNKPQLFTKSSDLLLQEILDALLSSFTPLLDWLDDRIAHLEDAVIAGKSTKKTLPRIAELRSAVSGIRRTLMPQREVLLNLSRKEIPLIASQNKVYFGDLYERLMQNADMIDRLRDSLSHLMELYMSQTSQRLNQIMKVLTLWATIFLPLTFLTGLWGMNFAFMPELLQPWGYWAALGLMAAVAVVMIIYFKKKRWL